MNSFDNISNVLSNYKNPSKTSVTKDELATWEKQWVFDALKGYRLGQSFCEFFNISNASPLYFFKDNIFSMRWIQDNYLENEKEIR